MGYRSRIRRRYREIEAKRGLAGEPSYRPKLSSSFYVSVPVPEHLNVRTVNYRHPHQLQLNTRAIRQAVKGAAEPRRRRRAEPLDSRKSRYTRGTARRAVPRHILRTVKVVTNRSIPPTVQPSKVLLDPRRGRMTISSKRRVKKDLEREYNRRRYEEFKFGKRRWRNGQLDSPGALKHGMVAAALRMGLSNSQIADAAMVARAL